MSELFTVKNDFLQEQYDKICHESGLTVYVFPKALSTAYASISVPFGSLDNTFSMEGEEGPLTLPDGIAHFLEHKMFESEDHVDTFDKFAAVGASANAYTSNELTCYLFSTPTDIEAPLRILLDYVFHPYFTDKNVEKEVGIVGQEIKMYEDSLGSRQYHALMNLLYRDHGIRTNICGTEASIAEITPALLMRCHRAFYRPERMTLIVCGNVETAKVMEIVDETVPRLAPIGEVTNTYPEEPREIYARSCELRMDIARPSLCVGTKDIVTGGTPEERERRAIAANMMCDLYFGESTAFYESLYNEGLVSRSFSAEYESLRDCGHFLCYGATDEPERLLARLREEFARIVADPTADEADFLRIRKVHYAEFIKDFDDTEEIATALLDAVTEGIELFDIGETIHSITLDEIYAVARELLSEDRLAYVTVYPLKGKEEANAS